MYIAVAGYKAYPNMESAISFILDTSDGVVERVRSSDIWDMRGHIQNLIPIYATHCFWISDSNFASLLLENTYGGYIASSKLNSIRVGSKLYEIQYLDFGRTVLVNDIKLKNERNIILNYIFRFKDYTVFRFGCDHRTSSQDYWFTLAIGDNGTIVQWSFDFDVCTDKKIAAQIDMLSEV